MSPFYSCAYESKEGCNILSAEQFLDIIFSLDFIYWYEMILREANEREELNFYPVYQLEDKQLFLIESQVLEYLVPVFSLLTFLWVIALNV